ncbi:enoyl-CoA hydratase [Endozoicomonas sp. (ex Bugula neritina AB1)]|nr:enoyl-CoA hydratase [Endozoicomonas sp. (ex Bugula neritina AB1)]
MSKPLHLSIEGRTAILTMNNPPANTWTPDSLYELRNIVQGLNQRADIIALIIKSDSDKFFCAGADLKRFDGVDAAEARHFAEAFGAAFETLSDFRGLSIAAINGYAMGGGLEVALACDLRVAEEQAVMALPEASVGLLPCAGGTQNLTMLVGEAWTKRMILCGEKVTAEKALSIGLVEEVVVRGESFQAAQVLANRAAKQSPDALRVCKQLIQMRRSRSQRDILPLERECFIDLFAGSNQQEGVQAFLEKRQPLWTFEE